MLPLMIRLRYPDANGDRYDAEDRPCVADTLCANAACCADEIVMADTPLVDSATLVVDGK
jgi:hypothetical protein